MSVRSRAIKRRRAATKYVYSTLRGLPILWDIRSKADRVELLITVWLPEEDSEPGGSSFL